MVEARFPSLLVWTGEPIGEVVGEMAAQGAVEARTEGGPVMAPDARVECASGRDAQRRRAPASKRGRATSEKGRQLGARPLPLMTCAQCGRGFTKPIPEEAEIARGGSNLKPPALPWEERPG